MTPRKIDWNQSQDFGRDFSLRKIDHFGPESVGNDLIESTLVNEPAVNQRLLDCLAIHACLLQNVISLRRLEDLLFKKNINDLLAIHVLFNDWQNDLFGDHKGHSFAIGFGSRPWLRGALRLR